MDLKERLDALFDQFGERMRRKGFDEWRYDKCYSLVLCDRFHVIRAKYDEHMICLRASGNYYNIDMEERFNENGNVLSEYLAVVNKVRDDEYTFIVCTPNNLPQLEYKISYDTVLPTVDMLGERLDYLIDKFTYYDQVLNAIIYGSRVPEYESEPYELYHKKFIGSPEHVKASEKDKKQNELRKSAEKAQRMAEEKLEKETDEIIDKILNEEDPY